MDPIEISPASKRFAELLRSASSAYPEYAVWAAVLESPLSEKARTEIESLLSEAFEAGLESLSGDKVASIMSRLAEILERERRELVAERQEAETLLNRYFSNLA